MSDQITRPVRLQVGIDAAVVANHHVAVRTTGADGRVQISRFLVPPTLAGLDRLTRQLSAYPGAVAVVEPTSMTWLGLQAASAAGIDLSLVGPDTPRGCVARSPVSTSPTSSTPTCWPPPGTCSA